LLLRSSIGDNYEFPVEHKAPPARIVFERPV